VDKEGVVGGVVEERGVPKGIPPKGMPPKGSPPKGEECVREWS
jgi:hypothetical protein